VRRQSGCQGGTIPTSYARRSRAPFARALALVVVAAGAFGFTRPALNTRPEGGATAATAAAVAAAPRPTGPADVGAAVLHDSLFGRSGKLRARLVSEARALDLTYLARLLGDSAGREPDVYTLAESVTTRPFSFIRLLPFGAKVNGRIGSYRVGVWPSERRDPSRNPSGFIRVTRENQETLVSEHFRLRDFLTHDQQGVWPKYLVLREELLDKLELVIADLNAHGTPVRHVHVMSGFRTPQYNVRGVGAGGRAQDSRHQYGDAADVFVDNDQDGWMDDLNGDGRVDHRDAQVIIDAADRVERAYPDLVGGAGRYRATRAHGPFAHIDARGARARWGNS
jgi:hypothetical protein